MTYNQFIAKNITFSKKNLYIEISNIYWLNCYGLGKSVLSLRQSLTFFGLVGFFLLKYWLTSMLGSSNPLGATCRDDIEFFTSRYWDSRICSCGGEHAAQSTDYVVTWPSGKLTFDCQKIAKNLTFKKKNCQKFSFFQKNCQWQFFWKKMKIFGN